MSEGVEVQVREAREYIASVERILRDLPFAEITQAADALKKARCIYICGNGGSMATAIHFAADLQKQAHLNAYSLDNISKITAYGNDVGYVDIFWIQLDHIELRDILVTISVSGNSKNTLQALLMAHRHGAQVISLTGEGGRLSEVADIPIEVPSVNMEQVEDVHLMICHMITRMLRC